MARKPSMDSIKTPDLNNLDENQTKVLNTFDRYTRAEDYSGKVRADFDRAQHVKDFELKSKEEPEEENGEKLSEEFTARRNNPQAESTLNKGVKVRGKYVARKKLITATICIVAAIVLVMFFAPPIFNAVDGESGCRSEDIFAKTGATQYRADIMTNRYVYNIEALSSDKSSSYRICTIAFKAKNFTPFEMTAEDYVIANGGDFSSHIVYSTYVGDSNVIPPFSTKDVKIEVLINKDGLDDKQFDDAITSLHLRTSGTKKKIGKHISIPTIPAWFSVSDVITFDPDA